MSTHELSRSMHERLTLDSGLHQAIERDEFELWYQPQIDLRTMRMVGMEALLRWRHPERGLLLPAHFLALAEERGFIVLIGDWVLRTACLEAKRVYDTGHPDFRLAVNLSPRQFRDDSLIDTIVTALGESGLPPANLEIEITETAAMEDVQLTFTLLTRLREMGVRVAIDDFGTGHSSLNYLKRFPIDTLKIDRSFVEDLPDRFEDAAIVRAVLELARGLDLRVVAEGVETKAQLDFLQGHECREVQGFYFAEPMPANEVRDFMLKGEAAVAR
jgi:EAL domain-containing protein (putative c-di-GMP-specific phosphodiesterase class I)